jgi:hypothetical protein
MQKTKYPCLLKGNSGIVEKLLEGPRAFLFGTGSAFILLKIKQPEKLNALLAEAWNLLDLKRGINANVISVSRDNGPTPPESLIKAPKVNIHQAYIKRVRTNLQGLKNLPMRRRAAVHIMQGSTVT